MFEVVVVDYKIQTISVIMEGEVRVSTTDVRGGGQWIKLGWENIGQLMIYCGNFCWISVLCEVILIKTMF